MVMSEARPESGQITVFTTSRVESSRESRHRTRRCRCRDGRDRADIGPISFGYLGRPESGQISLSLAPSSRKEEVG